MEMSNDVLLRFRLLYTKAIINIFALIKKNLQLDSKTMIYKIAKFSDEFR